MIAEAVAAGLVAVVILAIVLQPILAPAARKHALWEPPDPEETARGRALLALKEIEFDRATGKLSEEDYRVLRQRHERATIATLSGCDRCGSPLGEADRYCGNCGQPR